MTDPEKGKRWKVGEGLSVLTLDKERGDLEGSVELVLGLPHN